MEYIPEVFPWSPDHWQCDKCDSTYAGTSEFEECKCKTGEEDSVDTIEIE